MINAIKTIACLVTVLVSAPALAVETFPATNCESYNSPNTAYYNQVVHDSGAIYNFGYDWDLSTLIGCPVRWSNQAKSLKLRIHDAEGGLWCRVKATDISSKMVSAFSASVTRYSDGSGWQVLDFGNRPGAEFELGHVWIECLLPANTQIKTIILDEPDKDVFGGLTMR